jgi:hypothetical protein
MKLRALAAAVRSAQRAAERLLPESPRAALPVQASTTVLAAVRIAMRVARAAAVTPLGLAVIAPGRVTLKAAPLAQAAMVAPELWAAKTPDS